MGGSRRAQMIAPLKRKLAGVQVIEPGDDHIERFRLGRRPLERNTLLGLARTLSSGHYADNRECFSARGAFFDFGVTEIVGELPL